MKRTAVLVLVAVLAAFFVGRMSVNSDKRSAKEQVVAECKCEERSVEVKQKPTLATTIAILSACHICANSNECPTKEQIVTECKAERDEVKEEIVFGVVSRVATYYNEKGQMKTCVLEVDYDRGEQMFRRFEAWEDEELIIKCSHLKKGDIIEGLATSSWSRTINMGSLRL